MTVGLLVLGLLAVGACSSGDGDAVLAGSASSTAGSEGSRSSTTSTPTDGPGEGSEGGDEGEECEGETPVWAAKGHRAGQHFQVPIQDDPEDEHCEEGPVLGTGDLQITLRWEGDADYDLHVIEPDGTEIYYANRGPTDSGGQLDVDSNIGCIDNGGVENVFWPEGEMPSGDYTIKVVGYQVDRCQGGEYELVVKVQGEEVMSETGTVGDGDEDVYEIDV